MTCADEGFDLPIHTHAHPSTPIHARTHTHKQVLELKPDYSQAIDKRAKIYSSQGKFEEVRERRGDYLCCILGWLCFSGCRF